VERDGDIKRAAAKTGTRDPRSKCADPCSAEIMLSWVDERELDKKNALGFPALLASS